jgi:hypothetical protein
MGSFFIATTSTTFQGAENITILLSPDSLISDTLGGRCLSNGSNENIENNSQITQPNLSDL